MPGVLQRRDDGARTPPGAAIGANHHHRAARLGSRQGEERAELGGLVRDSRHPCVARLGLRAACRFHSLSRAAFSTPFATIGLPCP